MHLTTYANIYIQMKSSYTLFSDTSRSTMPNRLALFNLFPTSGLYNYICSQLCVNDFFSLTFACFRGDRAFIRRRSLQGMIQLELSVPWI